MIKNHLNKNWQNYIIFLIIFSLILTLFRSILFNLDSNLSDWNDYPLIIWIIYQNILHISNVSFSEIFNGNIFYPDQGTLLLSDLFIPQSLLSLFISKFIKNPITTFNLIYFTSWALNIVSAQYFWGKITKKKSLIFFGTLTTTISSYTIVNSVHFQMINYWPYLFGIASLLEYKLTNKNAFKISIWIFIQFLSGVYLGFFMLLTLALWYLSNIKKIFNKRQFFKYLNHLSIILLFLLISVAPLMYQYLSVKQSFDAVRSYSEYVQYSLHLMDYLFPPHLSSLIGSLEIIKKWASYGRGAGLFPGLTIVITFLLGFFTIKKDKRKILFAHSINRKNSFFTLLLLVGFIFSFGPRLNVSGFYTGIPLPYTFLLKYIPGFDIVRVTARWSWLFFIGLTFYSIKGLEKLSKKYLFVLIIAPLIFLIEIFPLYKITENKNYYSYEYSFIEPFCNANTVLIEYPMTQDKEGVDIVSNLTYRTQMMMATIKHKCSLINGYTGWIPKDYELFESNLYSYVENNQESMFIESIQNRGANIFKLNKNDIFKWKSEKIEDWLLSNNDVKLIYTDKTHTIIRFINEQK